MSTMHGTEIRTEIQSTVASIRTGLLLKPGRDGTGAEYTVPSRLLKYGTETGQARNIPSRPAY